MSRPGLKNSRVQGRFRACDEVPSFYEALRDRGVAVDFSIFEDDAATAVYERAGIGARYRAFAHRQQRFAVCGGLCTVPIGVVGLDLWVAAHRVRFTDVGRYLDRADGAGAL